MNNVLQSVLKALIFDKIRNFWQASMPVALTNPDFRGPQSESTINDHMATWPISNSRDMLDTKYCTDLKQF